MILSLLLLLSPASAEDTTLTHGELAKKATTVIQTKGTIVPAVVIAKGPPPITAHGWFYETSPTCIAQGAATYLIASDGTIDLSVAIVIPVEGVPGGVMVTAHDIGGDGIADFMSQEGNSPLLPDALTHQLFYVMLACIINAPPAPK